MKVLLALVMALASPAPAPAGWDHPGYDAEDSYYNPHESVINASSIGHLTRRWSVTLRHQDPSCSLPSAPLVADGRVIVTDSSGISAYQALSGHLAWHFTWPVPDDALTPQMAVAGNVLIAANGDCHSNSDPNGDVTALSLATGRVVWHNAVDTPIVTLAVDKGVAAISGSSPSDELTTIAFRTTDGQPLWRKPLFSSSGVSANGRLLTTHGNTTSAIAITTGAILWTRPYIWTAQAATPTSDRFVVTSGTTLALINAADGSPAWTAHSKASDLIATDGRRVYRSSGRVVEALDAGSGRSVWSRTLSADADQPIRAGGLLYTGGPILKAATGTPLSPNTAYPGHQLPADGHLYAVTNQTLTSYAP